MLSLITHLGVEPHPLGQAAVEENGACSDPRHLFRVPSDLQRVQVDAFWDSGEDRLAFVATLNGLVNSTAQ